MRALVWTAPGRMQLRDVPPPVAAPDEVVVAVGAAGVCGSDLAGFTGAMGNRASGHVMGHELAGTVVRAGAGVDESLAGLWVAVNPVVGCGHCSACAAGRPSRCPDPTLIGVHRPGGFAEEVAVPARNVVALPAGLPVATAALAEPLAQARHNVGVAHTALGGLVSGGTAVVIGAGPIGALTAWVATRHGFRSVAVIDPDPVRRRIAMDLSGAVEEVPDAVDVVFEAVGTAGTRRDALSLVRPGGVVVLIGLHDDETALPWRLAVRREAMLCGSNCMDPADVAQAVQWLALGQPALRPQVCALEDGPDLFAALAGGRERGMKWVLTPG